MSGKTANLVENVTLLDEHGARANGEARTGDGAGMHSAEHNGIIPDHGAADGKGTDDALSGGAPADEAPPALVIPPVPLNAVKIKGRPGGVAVELGEGNWPDLLKLLEERLAAAEGFFRGGRVVLEAGPRLIVESQLRELRSLLEAHEMKLGIVRSTVERTLQAALEVGLSTSSDELDDLQPIPEVRLPDAPPARPGHFVHRGSLRSGQILRKTESIVIIGDVNPGAQVISSGDIMIWGRLRGVAYAGADGNRKAVVTALDFSPTQLRIANLTSIAPDPKKTRGFWLWKKEPAYRAEIARVVEGRIVVEPWDDGKPGGPTILRR
ncbi:MAG: septum site-determining protein MinC [Caldilineaceae bacterium]|nr:septum site-determining protein MinC [Caldilineaceae bacterium]